MAIDNIIFPDHSDQIIPAEPPKSHKVGLIISGLTNKLIPTRANSNSQLKDQYSDDQKTEDEKSKSPRPRFVTPSLTVSLVFHRMERSISNAWKSWGTKVEPPPTPSQLTLRRMGSTRKLVTSLVRLLTTKPDVLAAFRKRLMRVAALKSQSMTGQSSDELEVAIYSGDVQGQSLHRCFSSSMMKQVADHILTLQHSFIHYERMLSELGPTYISQLHAEISTTKNKCDVNLLYLTTVATCCATSGIIIGRLNVFCIGTYLILIHCPRLSLFERCRPIQYSCSRKPLLLVSRCDLHGGHHLLHNNFTDPLLVEAVKATTVLKASLIFFLLFVTNNKVNSL